MSDVQENDTAAEPPPPHWRPAPRQRTTIIAVAALAVVAVLVILAAWRVPPFGGGVEVTDNAYVRGRTTVISPQVSGYVVAVNIHDYDRVVTGQVLVRIDDRIYGARAAQAHASLQAQMTDTANVQAQLARARADMARADNLVGDGSISIRERDQTRAALAQAEAAADAVKAKVEAAKAQSRLADIDLDNTTIRAPETGELGEVGVRLGQYVTNGTQLFSLVPDDRWVIANYKEAQIARMKPGDVATFKVDALGGARLRGHVERLSPAAGSEFSALKPDNATGNFVKVPQRIGVYVRVDPDQPLAKQLRPGMSVEMRVDTRKTP